LGDRNNHGTILADTYQCVCEWQQRRSLFVLLAVELQLSQLSLKIILDEKIVHLSLLVITIKGLLAKRLQLFLQKMI
jgi:hypothetical protein